MSSPNRSTFDIEDAFSSMNILNYTSVSSNYFPASSGSSSFNSSENSKDNMILPVFSSFYNNPCLKNVQAFYAKELPISSPDPITSLAILTLSPIAKPMTKLTQKSVKFNWGEKDETAFQTLKQKLCSAPILALPEGSENFVVYCDASHMGLDAVLMQKEKVIAYASAILKSMRRTT
ncbi:putative reverse transcriptase domain-containing protein [Tanacetum coccineum]